VTAGDGTTPTVVRWTISNGSCLASFEDINLRNYTTPTVSNAGPAQEQCNSGSFTRAGNHPVSGVVTWTIP
jgi:hypothetical protein